MTERTEGQVTWSDLGLWSGKTCPEPSAATKGETLRQSSKRSSASQNRKPPILKCLKKAGQLGGDTTMKWEDDGAWLGECMTRNTGESPNAAVVSRLSQILEETPQEKYSLSAKACQGILRRAERRGKDLPKLLKQVLLMQSGSGGAVMGVSHDVSGTLRAQEHGHQPAVIAFAQNQREEVRNVGDKAVSLAAEVGMHCQTFVALDMSHACDVIRDCGEVAPSLQARMGTGGNQIPLTYQDVTGTLSPCAHAGSYNGQDAYNDMLVCGATPDVARAILYQPKSAMEENWAASETKNALRAGESKVSHAVMCEDVSHALRANGACAYREDAETYQVQNMVVRRLTPMECERLQGFPDGWTDIGEWRDSKGKLRKPSDSPRYKALGNSIALPFWDFLAKRISAQYIRPVTMGSLFDGIGGFPLVFERHNGKGTARWASEIEEFPIAVTKLRFGGEDNGSQEVLLAEAEA